MYTAESAPATGIEKAWRPHSGGVGLADYLTRRTTQSPFTATVVGGAGGTARQLMPLAGPGAAHRSQLETFIPT